MRDAKADMNLAMVAERGEGPGVARVTGFVGIILEKGSDWQEFRNGLLRSVTPETFTAEESRQAGEKIRGVFERSQQY